MNSPEQVDLSHTKTMVRFDFISMSLVALFAIVLVFLLDTGWVAEWIAEHKETKIDEIIFFAIALLIAMAARKWLGVSRFLARYGEAVQLTPETSRVKNAQQRDLFGVLLAVCVSFVLVFFFDTGSIAEWIARHKDTKVDEVIVTGVILLVGLLFFSIRRWLELADQVARYEELHNRTSKLNREITLLAELGESLQSCLSIEEAHRWIIASAQVLFPGSSGAVCVIASSRDLVEAVATWGDSALPRTHFEPKDCFALRRGRLYNFDADPSMIPCVHLGSDRPLRSMCVPMMAHGETLGLLYLNLRTGEMDKTRASDQINSEQRLARTLAEQAALALANLNMRDALKVQSIRDPLTGLFNRRYMEESFDRELRRATRKRSALAILMIDIDHFKSFNDSFGHEAGDAVLRSFGTLLKEYFRGEDVLCRYGGEEFTVILPETSLEAARQRSIELCEHAKRMLVEHQGQTLRPISISVGVASFREHGTTAEILLRAADAALYLAKQQGRDRVVLADTQSTRTAAAGSEQSGIR